MIWNRLLPNPTITDLSGINLVGSEVILKDQIVAGRYDWLNDDITCERFTLTLPAGQSDLILAHFNRKMKSRDVGEWASDHMYTPALIEELLALGSYDEYRELQRKFSIIALGSTSFISGEWVVPCLDGNSSNRGLCLACWDLDWGANDSFLLRKVFKPSV